MSMKQGLLYGFAGAGATLAAKFAYRLAVPQEQDILPERLSTPIPGAGTPALAATLAANLNAPLVEGNRIDLYVNGREIFPSMLEAIRDAEETINFLTYIYWRGRIARDFAAALSEAARRGVAVRVLLDALGSVKMDEMLIEEMKAAGCLVCRFHDAGFKRLRRMNSRTHRKVMVVDGRTGFTGGVGIAIEWTGDAQDADHWRDDHFRVEGPVVRYLQGAFAENWRQSTGEVLAGEEMVPTIEPAGDARVVPVLGSPYGSVSAIGFLYWLMFQAAHETVRITTPYFAPDPPLVDQLVATALRGVDVTLLVPGELIDKPMVRWVAATFYERLLDAGVTIQEFEPTMLHVKSMTVDSAWSIIGSSNFDNRSFELNYEIALAVESAGLASRLDASFDDDLARSRRVTRADMARRTAAVRTRDRAARTLREQL